MKFAVKKAQCLGCRTPLPASKNGVDQPVCERCRPRLPDIYSEKVSSLCKPSYASTTSELLTIPLSSLPSNSQFAVGSCSQFGGRILPTMDVLSTLSRLSSSRRSLHKQGLSDLLQEKESSKGRRRRYEVDGTFQYGVVD